MAAKEGRMGGDEGGKIADEVRRQEKKKQENKGCGKRTRLAVARVSSGRNSTV